MTCTAHPTTHDPLCRACVLQNAIQQQVINYAVYGQSQSQNAQYQNALGYNPNQQNQAQLGQQTQWGQQNAYGQLAGYGQLGQVLGAQRSGMQSFLSPQEYEAMVCITQAIKLLSELDAPKSMYVKVGLKYYEHKDLTKHFLSVCKQLKIDVEQEDLEKGLLLQ